MPDAVRMWGVYGSRDDAKPYSVYLDQDRADAEAEYCGCIVIPGTFTPDEEGSDEQDA